WTVLQPESVQSKDGAAFQIEEDGSILVSKQVPRDIQTVTVKVPMKGARGFRLEALTWPTLAKGGPGTSSGGNFLLSALSLKSGEKSVAIYRPVADFSQEKFPVADVLDDKKETGWGI